MNFNAKILNDKTDIDKNNILVSGYFVSKRKLSHPLIYISASCSTTFLNYSCYAMHNKAK